MEILTFLNFVWPEVQKAFDTKPKKLLMVAMGIRCGGAACRPLTHCSAYGSPSGEQNGTSPLLHEMTHVYPPEGVTEHANDDWDSRGAG